MTESADDHIHEEYAVRANVICADCGEYWDICTYCNKTLHECKAIVDPRLMKGYRLVEEFPEYMVNNQCTVRHIQSQRYCMLVRVSKTGGAMINLRKDGKTYTKAAQDLRDRAFGVDDSA